MAAGYPLRAVIGLGNPGPEHARQRHNIGFWWVDALASSQGVAFRPEPKFQAEAAKVRIVGVELHLLKPQTFMNRSGQAVQSLMAFYKLAPEELLVVHDDLDLPVGATRIKRGGGHGGHNGLRDTSARIGEEYCRLRMGIGHPGSKELVHGYVLSRAPAEQQAELDAAVKRSVETLPLLLEQGWDRAATRLHTVTK